MKRIFNLKAENPEWSLNKIAYQLNSEGYRTKLNKTFSKVQVKRILDRKDFYKGIYQYGQIKAIGKH